MYANTMIFAVRIPLPVKPFDGKSMPNHFRDRRSLMDTSHKVQRTAGHNLLKRVKIRVCRGCEHRQLERFLTLSS